MRSGWLSQHRAEMYTLSSSKRSQTSVDSVASSPSCGSCWMKPPIDSTLEYVSSSRTPSSTMGSAMRDARTVTFPSASRATTAGGATAASSASEFAPKRHRERARRGRRTENIIATAALALDSPDGWGRFGRRGPRKTQRAPARGSLRGRRPDAGPRRRGLGKDAGHRSPHRVSDRDALGLLRRNPGGYLHQQGGRGDAATGPGASSRARARSLSPHVSRALPPPASPFRRGRGSPAGVHALRRGRAPVASAAGAAGDGASRARVSALPRVGVDIGPEERRLRTERRRAHRSDPREGGGDVSARSRSRGRRRLR